MLAVGLMSGTSLDGVDAALVDIDGVDFETTVRLVAFETLPMPDGTRQRILDAVKPGGGTSAALCALNVELGHLFSDAVGDICRRAGVLPKDLAFVASHGQTIWHNPVAGGGCREPGCALGEEMGYSGTLQLGDASIIAWDHDVTVVYDFRSMDMAAGGQGAPLVPFSEAVLYGDVHANVGLLNIGGIGNITVLPRGYVSDIFAFDTGPGNMMIDEACRRCFGHSYDKDGEIAASGTVIEDMLSSLMEEPYLSEEPPKSTGRELFGTQMLDAVQRRWPHVSGQDLVATLTAFTAESIASAVRLYVEPHLEGGLDRLITGGGGAHNGTLMRMLAQRLSGTQVLTQEDLGYSSDAKEAIAFAVLGNQTLRHQPSNVPSATGASSPAVLGSVIYPPHATGVERNFNGQEENQ